LKVIAEEELENFAFLHNYLLPQAIWIQMECLDDRLVNIKRKLAAQTRYKDLRKPSEERDPMQNYRNCDCPPLPEPWQLQSIAEGSGLGAGGAKRMRRRFGKIRRR